MKKSFIFLPLFFCAAWVWSSPQPVASSTAPEIASSSAPVASERAIRGIHLTSYAAASKRYREKLDRILAETAINTVVIDIKEEDGSVHIQGVRAAQRAGAYMDGTIPDLEAWLAALKKRGIYTVARIVVFKDNVMPRKNPALGVHNMYGGLWFDRKKSTWLDPYNSDAWTYVLLVALQCAQAGFDEVQFDYLRFPTDGALSTMRFTRPYSRAAALNALVSFLGKARQLLHPLGTKISIDIFGLTTTVSSGMGIGQVLDPMAAQVDYVCPMTYPSHYAKGEYGLANPNDQPYETIHLAMRDALRLMGEDDGRRKLRPYLQDFSLKGRGIVYHAKEVRAQIQAAADMHIMSWTLWNARCSYTLDAIRTPAVAQPVAEKGKIPLGAAAGAGAPWPPAGASAPRSHP